MPSGKIWTPEETEILTRLYNKVPKSEVMAALPGRTEYMINNRAFRLKLGGSRNLYSSHDNEIIRRLWGTCHIDEIANRLGRKSANLLQHARIKLKLPQGVPQGCESIVAAARRVGFSAGALRHMLDARHVVIRFIPTSGVRRRKSTMRFQCVDSFDVDEAVEWFTTSETLHVASQRTGYTAHTLKDMLARAGVPLPHHKRLNFRRIPIAEMDRVVREHMNLRASSESITAAAARVHIVEGTLSKWLRAAGVIGAEVRRPFDVAPTDVDRVVAARAWWRIPGETLVAAAKRHGIHSQTMVRWLEKEGIGPTVQGTAPNSKKYRLDPKVVDDVVMRNRRRVSAEAAE
jgi:transposase-like protein